MTQSFVSSSCMGEALAIREALLHVVSLNLFNICVRTDSQVLARAISSRRRLPELHGVLADIDDLAFSSNSPFNSYRFIFISRNCNAPADGLAKACLSTHLAQVHETL